MPELHCYEYVKRPFEDVRELLVRGAVSVFDRATHAAAGRGRGIQASLKANIAGLEIGKDVVIRVTSAHYVDAPFVTDAVWLELEWQAASNASLFPSMHAWLLAYPLGPNETQLDLRGTYEPPGGVIGGTADRLIGHRIAEACVHRFLEEVAERIVVELEERPSLTRP